MNYLKLTGQTLAFMLPLAVSAQTETEFDTDVLDLGDPIVVTTDFRPIDLYELGGSATVIDGDTIRQREAGHLDQILNLAPNVNSLNNTRTTLSDQPGHDRQETLAGSARLLWQARPEISIEALLSHVDADPDTGQPYDLDGRDLPHAPNYMFAVGALFQLTDRWYVRAEVEGKDAFYFSSRHQVRSDAYELVHARLGYRTTHWDVALWARNITDETIKTRGFGGFGNDPRKGYAVEPYFQFGDPRTIGISANYAF